MDRLDFPKLIRNTNFDQVLSWLFVPEDTMDLFLVRDIWLFFFIPLVPTILMIIPAHKKVGGGGGGVL